MPVKSNGDDATRTGRGLPVAWFMQRFFTESQRSASTFPQSSDLPAEPMSRNHRAMRFGRAAGFVFGIGAQVGFLITIWYLYAFLKDGRPAQGQAWFLIDLVLALQFAAAHSSLLYPPVRRYLTQVFPAGLYGCLFCVVTCLNLAVIFVFWRGSAGECWNCTGLAASAMRLGFYLSWVALFYSLHLSGLGRQTGLTQWLHWVNRRKPPIPVFEIRGVYRWMRHPIYLSFLGLIWFTPRMAWDHALLTFVWTGYILAGSYLKDERLARYVGEPYRRYQEQVAGYPGMFFGPLGRRRPAASASAQRIASPS
ncbi:methyltransferase family protein [Lignipirellula cremea]|uniref:Uncharacterized protein n=1 Tax=Lignipirellula cremea TaxID=2528010 RepID=A0A518DXU5_9BACT|nr:hypothetical protein [Lignipirellula cremea]QDU96615.1 hypothetical protein Pla8534_44360 [Lignipirellula cremea]